MKKEINPREGNTKRAGKARSYRYVEDAPIPSNRAAESDLPECLRELIDLLVDVTLRTQVDRKK